MNNENPAGNEETQVDEQVEYLIQTNQKVTYILNKQYELVNYQGFWHLCLPHYLKTILLFQSKFRARNTDIILASFPKTGTTWLKSLLFSVVNRFNYPKTKSPLLKHHPHELVHRLEVDLYGNAFEYPRPHHLDQLPSPRLFSTHLPYTSLPESVTDSGCRIVYISRNPFDTFVSYYLFSMASTKKVKGENYVAPSMEEVFEDYCEGRIVCGPFFDHVVGYKKKSLEQTDKVLFLQYEDLKEDTALYVKKLAEFVGVPFSAQEEKEGVVEDIIRLCSIQNLKDLEVNKSGVFNNWFEKKSYFRKGEVGDWIHHFTPSMVEKMNKVMEEKLAETGLSFRMV